MNGITPTYCLIDSSFSAVQVFYDIMKMKDIPAWFQHLIENHTIKVNRRHGEVTRMVLHCKGKEIRIRDGSMLVRSDRTGHIEVMPRRKFMEKYKKCTSS